MTLNNQADAMLAADESTPPASIPTSDPASPVADRVRGVLRDHGFLAVDPAALDPASSLFDAGMTSHATVNVMLALEDCFDVEFPDALLSRSNFRTIDQICHSLSTLGVAASPS